MSSWVRYCIAVYVGLLISGALVHPPWMPSAPSGARLDPYPEAAGPAQPSAAPALPADMLGPDTPDPMGRSATLDA